MLAKFTLGLIITMLAVLAAPAQSPAPIVVQAITPGASTNPAPLAPLMAAGDSMLKSLQEIKAANEELLRKQAVTLQQLEEMEKAAEQIKVYTKRG